MGQPARQFAPPMSMGTTGPEFNLLSQARKPKKSALQNLYPLDSYQLGAQQMGALGAASTGGLWGGGSGGACVEVGTPVVFPEGAEVTEEVLPCKEWIALKVGNRPAVNMHPDTLVSVWKKASELVAGDRAEVENGNWEPVTEASPFKKDSSKVKRTVKPGGVYSARGIRLHNFKLPPEEWRGDTGLSTSNHYLFDGGGETSRWWY